MWIKFSDFNIFIFWHSYCESSIIGFDKYIANYSVIDCNYMKMQYRGGSELLVEAGDQRRVIQLPSQIQGKVAGAKFIDRSVVITMR